MQLHTADGMRKCLTAGERDGFLRAAEQADRPVRTLCMTLAYAGCRLSEALALTADRVDMEAGVLVFESLKKRRTGIFRSVPVPPALLDALDLVHGIRELHSRRGKGRAARLWPWSRMTGWRAVHGVMQAAGLDGVPASPRGCGTVSGWQPSPHDRSRGCLQVPSRYPQIDRGLYRDRVGVHRLGVDSTAGAWTLP
jgi:integrase/recombinase XerD